MRKMFLPTMMVVALTAMGQTSEFSALNSKESAISHEQLIGHTPESYKLLVNSAQQKAKYSKRTKRAVEEGKAEIILEAHKVFGEFSKSGFQMLLDADATAYGELFYDFSMGYYGSSYDDFEYKIPENADCSESTENVVLDGEIAIQVPAGTYDYMILYPFPGEGMVMPNGEFAKYDNFEFKEGYTYRFVCEYQQNEFGYNQVFAVLYVDTDAAVTAMTLPANGMDFGAEESITIDIENRGSSDITGFTVSYQVDDNDVVTETYTGTIAAGETASYTFATKVDMSAEKQYEVKAWVTLEGDMIGSNDSVSGKCKHIGVQQLPFVYDFSTGGEEQLLSDWTILDVNGDNNKWSYSSWTKGVDGTMGVANCTGSWVGDRTGNDYLITLPLQLNAGDNHVIFHTKCINPDYATELLDVRYGASTDPETMTVIGDYVVKSSEWVKNIINFNVPEDGVYYVAFHAKSVDGSNVFVDDVTIDAGFFEVSPELVVDYVVLPYSNCDLPSEGKVGAVISNKGTGPTTTFTLSYSVNDGEKVSQEIADVINPTESKTYYFDTTADFSEVGVYNVKVEAEVGDVVTDKSGVVENYDPITELPVTTNFPEQTGYEEYWNEMNPGSWTYENMFSANFYTDLNGLENGLMTRCFYLDKPVRFKIQYRKGGWTQPGMYVAFGKAGADVSTYEKVYEDNEIPDAMDVEFVVPVEEAGSYSFIIVNSGENNSTLYLGEVVISSLEEYDVRVTEVEAPVAKYTPKAQFAGEGEYVVKVENRGSLEMTGVKASLYSGANLIATSEGVSIASGETKSVVIKATLPAVEVGNMLNLSVQVEGDNEDAFEDDNYYDLPHTTITATTLATEGLEEFEGGTGSWGAPLGVGNIYKLAVADELSSLTVGFAPMSEEDSESQNMAAKHVAVAVYELSADYSVGRQLVYKEFERGFGGLSDIEIDPVKLNPGLYFFEVQQLTTYNMGLAYEQAEDLYCYQNVEGQLVRTDGATLVIRGEFAEDAVVYAKDAAAVEFVAPVRKEYLYSDSENVTVKVKNMGCEEAEFSVALTINGGEAYTSEVALEPYEAVDVNFEGIDLSEPGEYVAVATVSLDGDENTANDSYTLTFVSVEEVDPYKLDFESCYDFDAAGDTFNPRWRTVSRLDYEVDSWWRFDYPHKGEPVGFIAFNPEATVPVVDEDLLPGFFPNSGKRFGAAFCTGWEGYQQGVLVTDTWLISPKLKLYENSVFELYVKTRFIETQDQELERYNLYISDTDDNFESFKLLGDEVRQAPLDWTKVEVDLAEYNGKEVYVAIQYVGEIFKNVCMMVDDIHVKTVDTSVGAINADALKVTYIVASELLVVASDSEVASVEIYNAQGQLTYKAENVGEYYEVSTADYQSGVYVAKVSTVDGKTVVKKFAR